MASVARAMLDGSPVRLDAHDVHPLPALPPNVTATTDSDVRLVVGDRVTALDDRTAVLRPPSLVVGVGASSGAPAEEVLGLVERVLADAGLSPRSVAELATVDAKAAEPGLVEAARQAGLQF